MGNTFQDTNYYNDIMKAYEAGLAKDTDSRDSLILNLNNSLKDSCKNYKVNPNLITGIDSKTGAEINIDLDFYIGKYKNNIEFSNSLKEQLLADEETYFVNKYGYNVYEYLLSKRREYITTLDENFDTTYCSQRNQSSAPNDCPSITSRITSSTNTTVTGYYDDNGTFIESQPLCTDNGLKYYDMLSKYLPFVNSEVTNRKIDYREAEHEFLMKINSIVNIIYYILFIVMVILLVGGNNLQLQKRAPFYIFLLFLPFLYSYFFKFLQYAYNYFTINTNLHGPKNAFLDTNGENSIIDAYNT